MGQIEVLLVDIGNSRIKSTEVIEGSLGKSKVWESLKEVDDHYPVDVPFVISSVRALDSITFFRDCLHVTSQTPLPIALDYKTVDTLGVDRLAAACGTWHLFPGQDSLILDIGTCMTIDFLDKDGKYHGGAISPGFKMRLRAMAHFTDKLPDISSEWEAHQGNFPGKSTKECLYQGALTGMVFEIQGYISHWGSKCENLNAVFTGGDAPNVAAHFSFEDQINTSLVEIGLYQIWQFNKKNGGKPIENK